MKELFYFSKKASRDILERAKSSIRYILSTLLRLLSSTRRKGVYSEVPQAILSDGKNPTFFGYHDKTPFSGDGSKVLAMSISVSDDVADHECSPMKIGYFERDKGVFKANFRPVTETVTWCWQQGCMLQWHPQNTDELIIFNDLIDGDYGSRVFDINLSKSVFSYKHPVYSLDSMGELATSLNFSRLGRLRPGYGYILLGDNTAHEAAPDFDGLFILNLKTGERRLVISLKTLAESVEVPPAHHYINHATFSPNGARIVFLHLWVDLVSARRRSRACEFDMETETWREIEGERIFSHHCWKSDNEILANTLDQSGNWRFSVYNLETRVRSDLNLSFGEDNHPMFHPFDKDVIITDTYPDGRRDQHLCLLDFSGNEIIEMASLYSPFRYRGQVRCDLHPRWDRDGRYVAVDGIHLHGRALYLFDCVDLSKDKKTKMVSC